MDVRIKTRFLVQGDADLDAETDAIFGALVHFEELTSNLSESDVAVVLEDRIVDMSVVVKAPSWAAAQRIASDAFFRAIEAAGGVPMREDDANDEQFEVSRGHIVQGTELVPAR
ncbi:hypothetical protein [Microbacterium testaceum]|uniref:hypothetical protein n=1 Tax=Microbacterium testaceum TaxID=2033 RepID=UPI0012ACB4C8|nr:hypothetical protein [Microbacterium testaceum]